MQINDKIVSSGSNSITRAQELKLFQRDHNKAIDYANSLPFSYSHSFYELRKYFFRDNEMDWVLSKISSYQSFLTSFKSLVAIILKYTISIWNLKRPRGRI